MNKVLLAYLATEPLIGHDEAVWFVWYMLCLKYMPTTVLRHKDSILAVLLRGRNQ